MDDNTLISEIFVGAFDKDGSQDQTLSLKASKLLNKRI